MIFRCEAIGAGHSCGRLEAGNPGGRDPSAAGGKRKGYLFSPGLNHCRYLRSEECLLQRLPRGINQAFRTKNHRCPQLVCKSVVDSFGVAEYALLLVS